MAGLTWSMGFVALSNCFPCVNLRQPSLPPTIWSPFGAIATLKKHGHRVPQDISVVGIDDIQMAALLDPPLTTVTQPIYEMGRQGMENILLRIQNPQLETSEILFETRLTIRQSTAQRPIEKDERPAR